MRPSVDVAAQAVITATTVGELRCGGQRWHAGVAVPCGQLLGKFFRGSPGADFQIRCPRCKSLARSWVQFSTGGRR